MDHAIPSSIPIASAYPDAMSPRAESWPDRIRRCFAEGRMSQTSHGRIRATERAVEKREIRRAVRSCRLVQDNGDGTAILVGRSSGRRPLHLIFSYDRQKDHVSLITVYEPDPRYWSHRFQRPRTVPVAGSNINQRQRRAKVAA